MFDSQFSLKLNFKLTSFDFFFLFSNYFKKINPKNIKGSTIVEQSGRVQILDSGDLLISNVRAQDAGLYSCMRSNEAGTVQGEAWLSVMGRYQ